VNDMLSVEEATEVMVDADRLWKRVGDFGTAPRWHPQVSGVTVIDGPTGRARLLQFKTGGEQLERLQAVDDAHKAYRYTVERTNLPVQDFTGELRVEAAAGDTSRIVWTAHFKLADEGDGRTIEAIRQFLHDGAVGIEAEYRPYANDEARAVDTEVAHEDQKTRTGTADESVRNVPPAGAWNDTSSD
jgi:Polyketide cyclase / dehydrase and lipid transport